MKKEIFLVACLMLTACGGRAARPVAATNDYDDRLTCDQLRAERGVDDTKLADLTQERKHAENNNIGMVAVSPLFIDLSSTERKEADALAKRNAVLDDLIARKCSAAPPPHQ
jgi:hypothetical protein